MKPYAPDAFEKTVDIYRKMLKVGISRDAVYQAMRIKKLDSSIICEVLGKAYDLPPISPITTPLPTITIHTPQTSRDSIVDAIIQKFKQRSSLGINKYNTTLDRKDLEPLDWIQHAQEELMDGILYLEKLKSYF